MSYQSQKATFVNDVVVTLSGHKGYGADIECDVEFTCTRRVSATWDQHGEGGEVEIITLRPFVRKNSPSGFPGTVREYLMSTEWLIDSLIKCIDPDKLEANWREYDDTIS